MSDYSCRYCRDNGCARCLPVFEPDTVHGSCGQKWKDHTIGIGGWAQCQPLSHKGEGTKG